MQFPLFAAIQQHCSMASAAAGMLALALTMSFATGVGAQTYDLDFGPPGMHSLTSPVPLIPASSGSFASFVSLGNDSIFGTDDFEFEMFGDTVFQLYVTSRGYIMMNSGQFLPENFALPSPPEFPAPRAGHMIMPFHDELFTVGGGIDYQLIGEYPYRRFIIEFRMAFNDSNTPVGALLGQVVLHETTDVIEFRYAPQAQQDWSAATATVALMHRNGTPFVLGESASSTGSVSAPPLGNIAFYPLETTTWTGVDSSTWNSSANWSNGVPNEDVTAIIPGGIINVPVVSSPVTVGGLDLLNEAVLTIEDTLTVARGSKGDVLLRDLSTLNLVDQAHMIVAGNFTVQPDADITYTVSGSPGQISQFLPITFNGLSITSDDFPLPLLNSRQIISAPGIAAASYALPSLRVQAPDGILNNGATLEIAGEWDAAAGGSITIDAQSKLIFSGDADLSGYGSFASGNFPELQIGSATVIVEGDGATASLALPAAANVVEELVLLTIGASAEARVESDIIVSSGIEVLGDGSALIDGSAGSIDDLVTGLSSSGATGSFEVTGDFFLLSGTAISVSTLTDFGVGGELFVRAPGLSFTNGGDVIVGGTLTLKDDNHSDGDSADLSFAGIGGTISISGQVRADGFIDVQGSPNVATGGMHALGGDVSVVGAETLSIGSANSIARLNGVLSSTGSITLDASVAMQIEALFGNHAERTGATVVLSGAADVNHDVSAVASGTYYLDFFGLPVNGSTLTISDGLLTNVYEFTSTGVVIPGNIAVNLNGANVAGDLEATVAEVAIRTRNSMENYIQANPTAAVNFVITSTGGEVRISGIQGEAVSVVEAGDTQQDFLVTGFQSFVSDFTINTGGDMSFGGSLVLTGNITDNGTGQNFVSTGSFEFAGENPQNIDATNRAISARRLIVGIGGDLTLSGDFAATGFGLTTPSLHVRRDARLQLEPDVEIEIGTEGAGEPLVLVEGSLISLAGPGITRPVLEGRNNAGSRARIRFAPTSLANIDGLVLENFGSSFSTFAMIVDSGCQILRLDNFSMTGVRSVEAAIRLGTGTMPQTVESIQLDGTSTFNINANTISGGWDGISFPSVPLVTITGAPTGAGNLYGASRERDQFQVLAWELLSPFQPDTSNFIGPNRIADATVDQSNYSFQINMLSGNPPFNFEYQSGGVFPISNDWLTIDERTGEFQNRVVGGNVITPDVTQVGNKVVNVLVSDSSPTPVTWGLQVNVQVNLEAGVPLDIQNAANLAGVFEFVPLTAADPNDPTSVDTRIQLIGNGGSPFLLPEGPDPNNAGQTIPLEPYRWQITNGDLPNGMTGPEQRTGVIAGTPDGGTRGKHTFTIRMSDSQGNFTEEVFTITVAEGNPPPIITTTGLPNAQEGEFYSFQLETKVGTGRPPLQWVLASGSTSATQSPEDLPAGIVISSSGRISGFPLPGAARFVSVSGQRVPAPYSLRFEVRDGFFPAQEPTYSVLLDLTVDEEELGPVDLDGENTVGGGCSVAMSLGRGWGMMVLVGLLTLFLVYRRRAGEIEA